jgi:UDP-N-acetylmuramyl pentapeptide phosphotransferase/UDP-N-acetylglucosamine-1-phosphate transferase
MMKMKSLGSILILAGSLILMVEGFTYFGNRTLHAAMHEQYTVTPILGGLFILAGIIVTLLNRKSL